MNSGAQEGWAVPATHVAPVVLLLIKITLRYFFSNKQTNKSNKQTQTNKQKQKNNKILLTYEIKLKNYFQFIYSHLKSNQITQLHPQILADLSNLDQL